MVYVLLVALPALLQDILRNELGADLELAVEVVASPAEVAEVLDRLARGAGETGAAAAAVAREDTAGLDDLRALLNQRRRVPLLILSADGRCATLYRPAHPPMLLRDPSPADLAHALRSSATHEF
jgi:hypothetical protein